METDPEIVFMAVGLNVTLIVQLAPAATLVPHVLVSLNWLLAAILEIVKSPAPLLVRVTVLALLVVKTTWVEKVRLVGESVTAGFTPTPVTEAVCGLPGALSVMLTAAFLVPTATGVKVTVITQLPPADTEVPQLLV